MNPKELGAYGERLAAEFLVDQGHRVLARNWRWRKGELDLVTEIHGTVVVVEVKTRRSHDFGAPEESITAAKQRKLVQTARAYLRDSKKEDAQWRIDLIAIDVDPNGDVRRIEHFEDAVHG